MGVDWGLLEQGFWGRGDGELTRALDVHEVGVGRLHEALELVLPLLELRRGVEEIDGESLRASSKSASTTCGTASTHHFVSC